MAAALSHLPLALGGDALSGDNVVIAVVSLASIVAGYGLLAALWYFVFRQDPGEKRAERPADASLDRGAGPPPGATSARSAAPAGQGRAGHDGRAKLERRPGTRFRRR